jgi:hypothetical protein
MAVFLCLVVPLVCPHVIFSLLSHLRPSFDDHAVS